MLLGTFVSLPALWRTWRQRLPATRALGSWCLLSAALGTYAAVPAICRRLSGNPEIGEGAWWNLFLFYPLFDRLPLPRMILGELITGTLFCLQYAAILLAIHRARQGLIPRSHTGDGEKLDI